MEREPKSNQDLVLLRRRFSAQLDALEGAKNEIDQFLAGQGDFGLLLNAREIMGSELGRLRELHQILTLRMQLLDR
jgi:hypothetical protein